MKITLEQLFDGDRPVLFKINSGDTETLANVSIATVKEMALAIHVCNERIQLLYQDLLKAEARIEKLERRGENNHGSE